MKNFTNILVLSLLSFVFSFANAQTNIFFSEWAEGSSNHKYFEIYNPTADTVDLSMYATANVSNAPTTVGVYEYWNDFASGAVILPYDVYVVAHPLSDASILAEADETFSYLSNGDDGFALIKKVEDDIEGLHQNIDGGMVILDSNHTHDHVLKELNCFEKFVRSNKS